MLERIARGALPVAAIAALALPGANADVVTDWNAIACQVVYDAKLGPPMANRALALTQTAVFDAVNRITGRYPAGESGEGKVGNASLEAAVAAANRATATIIRNAPATGLASTEASDSSAATAMSEMISSGALPKLALRNAPTPAPV